MKYSPITYVEFPTDSKELEQFHKNNCAKLAKVLKKIPRSQHKQDFWGRADTRHACNTVGCALGWAAMSNEFNGLQYGGVGAYCIHPVVNGERYSALSWCQAGIEFFGREVTDVIFYNKTATKKETIAALIKASI